MGVVGACVTTFSFTAKYFVLLSPIVTIMMRVCRRAVRIRVAVERASTAVGGLENPHRRRCFATGGGHWDAADSNPATTVELDNHHQALRRDLAAAHWLTNHFRMDDLTWNHISARAPPTSAKTGGDSSDVLGPASSVEFLVTPGDRLWDDVKPQDLVLSSDNVTANVIHEGIYRARPDVQAVVHLHTPSVTTVSCLAGGLQLFDQDGAQFASEGAVAYHDWEGLSDDIDEQSRIAAAFGPTAHTLIMRNHGACTVGDSVGQVSLSSVFCGLFISTVFTHSGLCKLQTRQFSIWFRFRDCVRWALLMRRRLGFARGILSVFAAFRYVL